MLFFWKRKSTDSKQSPHSHRFDTKPYLRPLRCEPLEDRRMLSIGSGVYGPALQVDPLPLSSMLAAYTAGISEAPTGVDLVATSDSGFSDSDYVTNRDNSTPEKALQLEVSGTVPAATVTVYAYGTPIGSATASGTTTIVTTDGSFDLADGNCLITARQTKPGKTESVDSFALGIIIDTTAPLTVVPDLQAASDSGLSDTDNITNDTTPTLDIATGPYYRVYRDGVQVSGDYETAPSYTSSELSDGTYDFTILAFDEAGNQSALSDPLSVTIDTAAPEAPTAPDLQTASDTGLSGYDNLTCDNTPTFDVSNTSYYRVFVDGIEIDNGYQTGSFTIPMQSDGTYSVAIAAVDEAGNQSALSAPLSVTIDTTSPAVPTAPDLQAASDSGLSDADNITNDTTPTFDITAGPYYRVYRDGVQVSDDYETASSYTSAELPGGTYDFTVIAFDEAGNQSALSAPLSVTTDTATPATPIAPDLQAASDLGISDSDNLTCDNTPTFEVLDTLYYRFFLDGIEIGSGYQSGSFTMSPLPDGTYNVAVAAVDIAGNPSALSDPLSVTIDTAVPAVPIAPDLQATSDSGVSDTDNITNDTTPTLDIATGPYYRVYRDGVQVSGDYETAPSYTSAELSDETYDFTILAFDEAGNQSVLSDPLSVTIDTTAPAVPTAPDLQTASDTGVSDSDNLTCDATPTFDVSNASYYHVFVDGIEIGNGYQTGSFTIPMQSDGTYSVAIAAVDEAGNQSALSAPLSVTIDTAAPAVPIASDLQATSDSGVSDTDNITNDTTPTLDIAGAPYYRLYHDGILISGDFETAPSYTSPALPDGVYNYTIVAIDAAGNESAISPALSVTIDTVVPEQGANINWKLFADDGVDGDMFGSSVSVDNITAIVGAYLDDDNGYNSGSAYLFEQTATGWEQVAKLMSDNGTSNGHFGVSVSICGITVIVGACGDDNGSGSAYIFEQTACGWEQTAKLTPGNGVFGDGFGSSVAISDTIAIVGEHLDNDNGSNSGSAYVFEQTDTGWHQIAKLTSDDGADDDLFGYGVSIDNSTAIIGAYLDDDNGYNSGSAYIFEQTVTGWEQVAKLTPDDGVSNDHFGCSVSISGTTAIVGASGSAYIFEQTPSGWEQIAKFTSYNGTEGYAFGKSVSISGATAVVGSPAEGMDSGSVYLFKRTDTGWERVSRLEPEVRTPNDHFGYSVVISDATVIAGTEEDSIFNHDSPGFASIFSNAIPVINLQAASDTGISDADNVTNDTTPTFDITAGPYYRVYRDGVQVSGDHGTASSYTSEELSDGTYDFTVIAIDEAGNETFPSVALSITIDTVAPNVLWVIPNLQASSDLGISGSDNLTCDNTPTFDVPGTIYYRFFVNGTEVSHGYQSGSFTTATLPDGAHNVAVTAVDAAGNSSVLGAPLGITIDTVAPTTPTIAPDLQAASDSGVSNTDNVTNDKTPTFDIFAASYYCVYQDGVQISGNYETATSYTSAVVLDGTYNYTVVAVDEAGNKSTPSPALDITIDITVPLWNELITNSKLLADDGAASDAFGEAVSISGTTAIVGVRYDDDNGSESGSAYIFEQTPNGWEQVAKLTPEDGAYNDRFGCSVAIYGTMAIVGAFGDNASSGSAYVFEKTAAGWEQVAKLTADDSGYNDYFGISVSIGHTIAIVGACYDDDNGSDSGSAYIFEKTATGWEQIAKLMPSDGMSDDRFGNSVSISDTTAIVGSYYDDDNGNQSGSAYIFEQTVTGWVQSAKLTSDDGTGYDRFGGSVSISGAMAVVGARHDDDNGSESGSAYIFEQKINGWEQVTKLTPDDGTTNDYFGTSVSISGVTTIIGAYYDDDNGSESGSAYLFEQKATGWEQIIKLTPSDGVAYDRFGISVSISNTTAIVGACGDDDNGNYSGSAYVSNLLPIGLQSVSDTGISDMDNITSDTTPIFDITAGPYYRVYRDGVQVSGDYETASTYTSPTLPYAIYEYEVHAIDEAGNKTISNIPLTVTIAPAPSANVGGEYVTDEGGMVTLDASSSTTPNGTIVSYEWDLDGDGQFDDADGATVDYDCPASGTYAVAVRVTDSLGLCDTDATIVTVNNVAPTADAGGAYVCAEGGRIRLDASGSTDPGNDIVSYEWDLDGDGQYDDASGVTAYFDSVSIGNYPVSVRVTDEDGAFDTDDVVVEVRTPQTITVTSLQDNMELDGLITLREAIMAANYNAPYYDAPAGLPGMDRIAFDPSLFESGPATLFFSGNLSMLFISDHIDIQGPGPDLLTIDGNGTYGSILSISGKSTPNLTATIHGLTITGGGGRGGGIYNYNSTTTISNCIITGNARRGIDNYYGTVTISNSTIFKNQAGGIYNGQNSDLIITNSAIINNVITPYSQSHGGGIWSGLGTVTITNSTITGNSADWGGGIFNTIDPPAVGTVTLNNTIVAGNQATFTGHDLCANGSGAFAGSYNLIGDGSSQTDLVDGVDGNQIGTTQTPIHPRLGSDGRPLPNSPAIDAGNNALAVDTNGQPLTADLAGNDRIFNDTVDIGAYEVPVSPFYPGDANLDGRVDGADVTILAANWQTGVSDGQTATWSMGDFNADGKVDGSDVTILAGNWQAGVTSAVVAVSDPEPKPEVKPTQFAPPATASLGMVTVPRRETLPSRRLITPTPETTDAVLAESTWNENDMTAIAKDIASTSVKKSDAAINGLLTLELDPYMDYE